MIKRKTTAGLMGLAMFVLTAGNALAQQSGTTLSAEKTATGFSICVGPVNQRGVQGQVCVTNGGGVATEGLTIFDRVQSKSGSGQFQDLAGAFQIIVPGSQLKPGETVCYPYKIVFDPPAGHVFRNAAKVTITNHSGWLPGGHNCPGPAPCAFGPEPKADFTVPPPLACTPGGCTRTQGYWKNHPAAWPVSALSLGSVGYSQAQLLSILNQPVGARGGANGLISLAHQLIAAKLNVAAGAGCQAASDAIALADALIGTLVVPPVGAGYLHPSVTSPLVTELDSYNQGKASGCPAHCEE